MSSRISPHSSLILQSRGHCQKSDPASGPYLPQPGTSLGWPSDQLRKNWTAYYQKKKSPPSASPWPHSQGLKFSVKGSPSEGASGPQSKEVWRQGRGSFIPVLRRGSTAIVSPGSKMGFHQPSLFGFRLPNCPAHPTPSPSKFTFTQRQTPRPSTNINTPMDRYMYLLLGA